MLNEEGGSNLGISFMVNRHWDEIACEFAITEGGTTISRDGKVRTATNNSGGVQGGISNGENVFFRVAFKPPSTIAREQKTVTAAGEETTLAARGRQGTDGGGRRQGHADVAALRQ